MDRNTTEKNAYHTVLHFLKSARNTGNSKNKDTYWESFVTHIQKMSLSPLLKKAIKLWAIENLTLHHPEAVRIRELHEFESLSISPKAYGTLLEAIKQGMISVAQSEDIIDELMNTASFLTVVPENFKEMEEIITRFWMKNASKYKDMKVN